MVWNKIMKTSTIVGLLALTVGLVGCSKEKPAEDTAAQETADSQETQLYTCGMHPNVIQEEPGNCPICGMKLTPLGQTVAATTTTTTSAAKPAGERKILYWQAPMDPTYISPKPGKSPMGMDLIPVYEGEEAFGSTVKINPVIEQNIGVRTAIVERRDLTRVIRTIGNLDYDEARVGYVQTKFSGWIEKTYVNTTGEAVKKGDILLEIYSPQLVTAQEEYLDALDNLRQATSPISRVNLKSILASTRRRLEYFDISESQILELERTGQVRKTLHIVSPFDGIVTEKHALDGMEVKPGMRLYIIADLSEIWVYADIYEFEVPWVEEGQEAVMTLSYQPGKVYRGKVQYVYPYLEEKTRTVKVRLTFPNPNLDLKPGMYANVDIHTSPITDAIVVPTEAVLFSGERNLVFVALGGGRFAPRDVTVGLESGDGYYEIREGLKEGEKVVTSAQFMLDSESKLQESIAKMLASRKSVSAASDEKPAMDMKDDQSEENAKPMKQHKMDMNMDGMDMNMDKMDMDEMKMEMEQSPATMPMEDHDDMKDMPEMKTHKKSQTTAATLPFGEVVNGTLTYYTCPMEDHAFVRVKEPGSCPECGMTLVQKSEPVQADQTFYTCPMPNHDYVVMNEPGECPLCGMDLIPLVN
jgi:Cu(I)/Ag(I) efflux system membrane fusion protein/cobalt-zinc-cadmium efflux system membrane fusion protein